MSFKKLNEGLDGILKSGTVPKVDTAKKLKTIAEGLPNDYVIRDRLLRVDPNRALPWYLANRATVNDAFIDRMARDLLASGQTIPALAVAVAPERDGVAYHLIAGQTRWRACLRAREIDPEADVQLQIKLLHDPGVLYEVDDRGAIKPQREDGTDVLKLLHHQQNENVLRRGVGPYDDGRFYQRLLKEGIFGSQKELLEAFGLTKGTLSKLHTIAETLPEEVNCLFPDPEELSVRELYGLARKWAAASPAAHKKALSAARHALTGGRDANNARVRTALVRSLDQYVKPARKAEPGFSVGSWQARVERSAKGVALALEGDIDADWFEDECRAFLETLRKKAEKRGKTKS